MIELKIECPECGNIETVKLEKGEYSYEQVPQKQAKLHLYSTYDHTIVFTCMKCSFRIEFM